MNNKNNKSCVSNSSSLLFFNNDLLSDLQFHIIRSSSLGIHTQTTLNAHRVILASHSAVFRAMFANQHFQESYTPLNQKYQLTIDLSHFNFCITAFTAMLRYCYSRTLPVLKGVAETCTLLECAEMYQIEPLIEAATQHLMNSVGAENIGFVLDYLLSKANADTLLQQCFQKIVIAPLVFLGSPYWLRFSQRVVRWFAHHAHFPVSEEAMFEACHRWSKFQTQQHRHFKERVAFNPCRGGLNQQFETLSKVYSSTTTKTIKKSPVHHLHRTASIFHSNSDEDDEEEESVPDSDNENQDETVKEDLDNDNIEDINTEKEEEYHARDDDVIDSCTSIEVEDEAIRYYQQLMLSVLDCKRLELVSHHFLLNVIAPSGIFSREQVVDLVFRQSRPTQILCLLESVNDTIEPVVVKAPSRSFCKHLDDLEHSLSWFVCTMNGTQSTETDTEQRPFRAVAPPQSKTTRHNDDARRLRLLTSFHAPKEDLAYSSSILDLSEIARYHHGTFVKPYLLMQLTGGLSIEPQVFDLQYVSASEIGNCGLTAFEIDAAFVSPKQMQQSDDDVDTLVWKVAEWTTVYKRDERKQPAFPSPCESSVKRFILSCPANINTTVPPIKYNLFRLRMTALNAQDAWSLSLSKFDIRGTVYVDVCSNHAWTAEFYQSLQLRALQSTNAQKLWFGTRNPVENDAIAFAAQETILQSKEQL